MFKDFTKWMSETATVLFDDTKNALLDILAVDIPEAHSQQGLDRPIERH